MCGRYTQHHSADQIAMRFDVTAVQADITSRYNIAPMQPVAVVTVNSPRTLREMRWGLVPFWAKDPAIGNKLINARAETLIEKPAFRYALAKRRCLIPADGFYEWQKVGNVKQPMHIRRKDGGLFAFAGLWEEWRAPNTLKDSPPICTCTIITVAPNELMAPIHNRMPAILRPEDEKEWLGMSVRDMTAVIGLLSPYPAVELEAFPVSKSVNAPSVDNEVCIQSLVS